MCVAGDEPHQLIKYDTRNLPSDFLCSNVNKLAVNNVSKRLENEVETQTIIDDASAEFCNVVDNEKRVRLLKIEKNSGKRSAR